MRPPSSQLVHALEISDGLWDQNAPLVAITLVTDRGLEAGGLEGHWLVPSLAQLVAGAQLFAEHLDADPRGKDLAQQHGGGGATKVSGVRALPKGAINSCPNTFSFELSRPLRPRRRAAELRLTPVLGDRTEVLCAVSRVVVVRPVGAAPVRCVYSRPGASPQADCVLYNPLVTALEEPRTGPGWCTGSAQHCWEHCRITWGPASPSA
jgi:hypothetical protein